MVKNGEFFMIKEMKQRGMSITAIANELGRDRKTIRSIPVRKGIAICKKRVPPVNMRGVG